MVELNEVEVFGDTAYDTGTFTMNPGGEPARSGEFLIIAQRMDGGRKFTRHIFDLDQPPEPQGDP